MYARRWEMIDGLGMVRILVLVTRLVRDHQASFDILANSSSSFVLNYYSPLFLPPASASTKGVENTRKLCPYPSIAVYSRADGVSQV